MPVTAAHCIFTQQQLTVFRAFKQKISEKRKKEKSRKCLEGEKEMKTKQ